MQFVWRMYNNWEPLVGTEGEKNEHNDFSKLDPHRQSN